MLGILWYYYFRPTISGMKKYLVHITPNTGVTAVVSTKAFDAREAQHNIMTEHPEARVTAVLLAKSH